MLFFLRGGSHQRRIEEGLEVEPVADAATRQQITAILICGLGSIAFPIKRVGAVDAPDVGPLPINAILKQIDMAYLRRGLCLGKSCALGASMPRFTHYQRTWIGWFATNSVGWFLCLAALVASGMATGDTGEMLPLLPSDLPGYIAMYSSIWGVLGLIQSWLLSSYTPNRLHLVLRWVGACILGWNVFWLLMYMSMSSSGFAGLAEIVIGACSVGVFQSLALRPFLANSHRWILATIGTIGLLLLILWGFDEVVLHLFGGGSALQNLIFLLPGCLYGAFTGWALIILLRQTAVQSSSARVQ